LAVSHLRNALIAGGVFGLAALATAATPPCEALAQDGACAENCKADYGSCYKATQNRVECSARLARCLEGCVRGKRG
jgi:hypothetical protein